MHISTANRPEIIAATPEDPCCIGHAMYGPERCTCWRPIYDIDVEPIQDDQMVGVRDSMCHDCAFKPDSPERQGHEDAACAAEEPGGLPHIPGVFVCHQGMPKLVGHRHCETGVMVESMSEVDSFNARDDGAKAYKADGTPADLCAGFVAHRLAAARERA